MNLTDFISAFGLMTGVASFIEWRIRELTGIMADKMSDKEKLASIVQEDIKADISRLESKIDMIISVHMSIGVDNDKRD